MYFDQDLKDQVDLILKQKKKMGSKILKKLRKREDQDDQESQESFDGSQDEYMKTNFPAQYAKLK